MEKSRVYFSKIITEENIVKIYKALNKELKGKVAVKVHSGEKETKIIYVQNLCAPLLIM